MGFKLGFNSYLARKCLSQWPRRRRSPPTRAPRSRGSGASSRRGTTAMDTPAGRVHWTCTGCGNFFNELNATKAAAHVLLLGGFRIVPCMSWRKIPAAKLGKLRMIHTKAEEERERRARKRSAEEAALSENNSAAGAVLSSQRRSALWHRFLRNRDRAACRSQAVRPVQSRFGRK